MSPEQRQRPPSYRGGQQGAEEVAGAEAEAAEVAGEGSKGQRKSPEYGLTYDSKPTARIIQKRIFADLMTGKITPLFEP